MKEGDGEGIVSCMKAPHGVMDLRRIDTKPFGLSGHCLRGPSLPAWRVSNPRVLCSPTQGLAGIVALPRYFFISQNVLFSSSRLQNPMNIMIILKWGHVENPNKPIDLRSQQSEINLIERKNRNIPNHSKLNISRKIKYNK